MRGRKPNPEPVAPRAGPPAPVAFAPADGIAEPGWRMLAAPDYASAVAELTAEKWRELLPQMREAGTIGPENVPALEMLCTFWARWRLAEAEIARLGPILKAKETGVPMHNPYISTANQAADRFIKLAAELGLTPAMRGRVGKRPLKSAGASKAALTL